jgi:hypothetical protein
MIIPRVLEDLTLEWCAAALDRSVTSVTCTPIAVGVGLVGQLARLQVDGPDGTSTVIAKLAAPTEDTRFVGAALNMYGREVAFYKELSARTPIPHPECYYAAHDPDTQDTALLLEDVSPRGDAYDQILGCTVAEARPAIRTLARLHASFWDEAGIQDTPWLLRLCDSPYPEAVAMAYDSSWPSAQTLFPDEITPAVQAFGDRYTERIPALFAKLSEPPLVLSHADWRLDNLFFTPDGDVVAVDWQLIDRSVAPRDLAYLVTQSLNVETRDDHEVAFTGYLDDLATHGVRPGADWAWDMYRYGTMLGFVYPIIVAGGLTIEDPRHVALAQALLQRSLRAIELLDAFDLPL